MARKSLKNTWETSRKIEELYKKLLKNLLDPAKREIIRKSKDKEEQLTVEYVETYMRKFASAPMFLQKADEIARRITTMTLAENAKDWRDAARQASRNPKVYNLLMKELENDKEIKREFDRILENNAKLIKTLPLEIAQDIVKHIASRSFASDRPETISKEIKKFFPEHTKAKEKLIARTESAKAKAALKEARAKSIGVYWYVWHSTDDQRTRPAHAFMNNVICNYEHNPSPEELAKKYGKYEGKSYGEYTPGGIFNCRCFAEPIIELSLIKFPCKAYDWDIDDVVQMNSAQQFKEFAESKGMPLREYDG